MQDVFLSAQKNGILRLTVISMYLGESGRDPPTRPIYDDYQTLMVSMPHRCIFICVVPSGEYVV